MPHGYFDDAATKLLVDSGRNVVYEPAGGTPGRFPETAVGDTLENTWHASATRIYRNWLQLFSVEKG